MRRDLAHPATVSGPRRGLALVVGLALTGTPAQAHAQEPGAPPPMISQVQPARPVPLELRIGPERLVGAARLRITPQLPGLGQVNERPVFGPSTTLMLRPGPYTIEAFAGRHRSSINISVTPGMGPISMEMQRPTGEVQRFESNRKLTSSLGVVALIQLVTGAGLTLGGAIREGSARRRNETLLLDALIDAASPTPKPTTGLALVESTYSTASYHRDLSRALTLQVAGAAVMMAGVAAGLTAVPVGERHRLRAAYIEMGIGAALAAGGATWLTLFERDRKALVATTDPTERATPSDLRPLGAAAAGGGLLTGLGVGLVVFPAIALLSNSVLRRRSGRVGFSPYMTRGQAGFSIHGRF
jgi:hypothetical protein